MSDVLIRRVVPSDLSALTAIYNHYIETSAFTFDLRSKSLDERKEWMRVFQPVGRWQCFVAEYGNEVIGWANSGKFREKDAYYSTVETSVYLKPDAVGLGIGKRLYATLFDALQGQDVHRAIACLTMPNDPSVALHKATGFVHVGDFHEVGHKFGRYWDVAWYEKSF